MRTSFLTLLMLTLAVSSALAQDDGMQAVQQAQLAAQAAQQASDHAMRDAQQATQNAQQQAMQNTQQQAMQCYGCYAATPTFSVKPGAYTAAVTLKIRDSTRGAVIYYTTDGWTPTPESNRYAGPITIDSTTTLQAIATTPFGGRSRVAIAVYTLNGVLPTAPAAKTAIAAPNVAPNSDAVPSASAKVLLARDTAVPFVFASDVSSKTADVGDKISLTLADDLKAGDVVVVRKGTPSVATVTEVDKTGIGGTPGEIFFQVDSLQAGSALIKLRGNSAKEGQDKYGKAMGLMFIPMVPAGLFVHGRDAEIKQGAVFTAVVDADTLLPPAN